MLQPLGYDHWVTDLWVTTIGLQTIGLRPLGYRPFGYLDLGKLKFKFHIQPTGQAHLKTSPANTHPKYLNKLALCKCKEGNLP